MVGTIALPSSPTFGAGFGPLGQVFIYMQVQRELWFAEAEVTGMLKDPAFIETRPDKVKDTMRRISEHPARDKHSDRLARQMREDHWETVRRTYLLIDVHARAPAQAKPSVDHMTKLQYLLQASIDELSVHGTTWKRSALSQLEGSATSPKGSAADFCF